MLITSKAKNFKHLFIILVYGAFFSLLSSQSNAKKNQDNLNMNRLSKESSPYLLQHKNNPVNWYPWGKEAFEAAIDLDRPIFLSIGYSTCHWCHVMEHESFEDEQVAKLLNDSFISIKVDREESPEIDHVYMSVCQAMTGRGGWPLTIIMTPKKEPFFAGTYFPKKGIFGRPGMMELLPSISNAWKNDRKKLTQSAGQINKFLLDSNRKKDREKISLTILRDTYYQFTNRYDSQFGGFGTKPKFPSPHNLIYLLRYNNMNGDVASLAMVEKTIQSMRMGGIFDQIGYGFHRYSTDREWLVPHFEKMLYDQSMILMAYTEAYQITKNSLYKKTANEILEYVERNMTDKGGGFYSAEDADSENEEGLFYFWTAKELKSILNEEEYSLFNNTYNIKLDGNFKDEATRQFTKNNIPHLKEIIVNNNKVEKIEVIRKKLYKIRERRIRPFKDDKILTDWNGLMIAAMSKAGVSLKNKNYIKAAEKAASFVLKNLSDRNGRLKKRYRNGNSGIDAHLDDYAFFIWGLLELYEATFNLSHLEEALRLNEIMIEEFWSKSSGAFYLGSNNSEQLIVKSMSGYDGAIPSGNSISAMNLLRIGKITGKPSYTEMAEGIFSVFSQEINKSPSGFTSMLSAYLFEIDNPKEIVVVGSGSELTTISALEKINSTYNPNKILLFKNTDLKVNRLASVAKWTANQKRINGKTTFYVCKNFICNAPTTDLEMALRLINE